MREISIIQREVVCQQYIQSALLSDSPLFIIFLLAFGYIPLSFESLISSHSVSLLLGKHIALLGCLKQIGWFYLAIKISRKPTKL